MKYPSVEQIDACIKLNLNQIFSNRPDLYYALTGTGFFNKYVNHIEKEMYRAYLRILNFSYLNKIKPFDDR